MATDILTFYFAFIYVEMIKFFRAISCECVNVNANKIETDKSPSLTFMLIEVHLIGFPKGT